MIASTQPIQSGNLTWVCGHGGYAALIKAAGGVSADGTLLDIPVATCGAFAAVPTSGQPIVMLAPWNEVSYFGSRKITAKINTESDGAYSDTVDIYSAVRFAFELSNRESYGLAVLNVA